MSAENQKEKLREQLFGVRMSVRYHRSRQMFFERCAIVYKAISVLSATAVFAAVIASLDPAVALYGSIVVALSHVLDLVTEPSRKALTHNAFAQEFIFLEKRIEGALLTGKYDAEQVAEFVGERLTIETKEPPTLLWLTIRSRNDQIIAQNGPEAPEIVKIPWLQKRLLHLGDVCTYKRGGSRAA